MGSGGCWASRERIHCTPLEGKPLKPEPAVRVRKKASPSRPCCDMQIQCIPLALPPAPPLCPHPIDPSVLSRRSRCLQNQHGPVCLHCHLPMSVHSCWSPLLHGKAACGGIGWKRERVVGAEMEAAWIWLWNNPPPHMVSPSISLLP